MEVNVMIRLDRDEVGDLEEPIVRVFSTPEAAKDAMRKDYEEVKSERYPVDADIFADERNETDAEIVGEDDTDVFWIVKSATVE